MDPFLPGTCWDGCNQPYLFPFAVASLKMVFDPPLPVGPPNASLNGSLTLNVAVAQWSLRFTPLVMSLRSMSLPLNGRFARYVADAQCRYRSMVASLDMGYRPPAKSRVPHCLRSFSIGASPPTCPVGPPLLAHI